MNDNVKSADEVPKPKKMGGAGFHTMLIFTLIKDFLDVLFTLSIILWPISLILSVVMSIVIFLYYFNNNVGFIDKKLAVFIIGTLIEWLPVFSLLPMTTATLVTVRYLENHERLKKFIKAIAGVNNPANFTELINSAASDLSISRRDATKYSNDNYSSQQEKEPA